MKIIIIARFQSDDYVMYLWLVSNATGLGRRRLEVRVSSAAPFEVLADVRLMSSS